MPIKILLEFDEVLRKNRKKTTIHIVYVIVHSNGRLIGARNYLYLKKDNFFSKL